MSKVIEAFVFDAYGTLFDTHSVVRKAEALFHGKGPALSAAWRAKQLEYSWLRALMGRYEDFASVTSDALDWSLESLGLRADATTLRSLLDEYRRLAPYPEVPATLAELSSSLELAILSNGHPDMLRAVVEHNDLARFFRGGLLSVHAVRGYKPDPRVYRLAEERLGRDRRRVGFVSSSGWDAAGAKAFGFRTFWVNRTGAPLERLGVRPDETLADLTELTRMVA